MIRMAKSDDLIPVTELALKLWPEHDFDSLKEEMRGCVSGKNAAVFLYYANGIPAGFAQVSLRVDYVEGSDSSPVGYLEGIYVNENVRNKYVASKLVQYCEAWAKDRGAKQLASDCELDNAASIEFHGKVGFTEANRIVCFIKKI